MANEKLAGAVIYHHYALNALECLGCGEMIEIPKVARLKIDGKVQRVVIYGQPENFMYWRQLHERDHERCSQFRDAEKSKDYREHRVIAMPRKG